MKLPKGIDLNARFKIMAIILHEHYVSKQGMHSRIYECVIYNEWINVGKSVKGGGRIEHVVPLAFLTAVSNRMFEQRQDIEEVVKFLKKNLKVVEITKEEANNLDRATTGLKSKMPDGWDGTDEFARLKVGGIEWRRAA